MKLRTGAIVGALALLTACGPEEHATSSVADAPPANEQFDTAVYEMTTAYFYHVPEAATQLGVSEDVVPGTADRMMDRSVDGNAARNGALEAALTALNAIDAELLSTDRRRTHAVLTTLFDGRRRIIPGRTANLTEPKPGRSACRYRNACWLGCPFGAYFSTQSSTLPAAAATGKLTLMPFAIVTEVLYDRDRKRATGVHVVDAVTERTTEFRAPLIFLCASALNSTWILMRSATDVWPGGLGSSSGELGHNLMDHHFRVGAAGTLEESSLEDKYYFGRRPTGFYIPRYRNLGGERRDYLRGFGYQGMIMRTRNHPRELYGEDLKKEIFGKLDSARLPAGGRCVAPGRQFGVSGDADCSMGAFGS